MSALAIAYLLVCFAFAVGALLMLIDRYQATVTEIERDGEYRMNWHERIYDPGPPIPDDVWDTAAGDWEEPQ